MFCGIFLLRRKKFPRTLFLSFSEARFFVKFYIFVENLNANFRRAVMRVFFGEARKL